MSGSERGERGRFSAKHSDDEVLDAVRKHGPAGTTDVAEELGIKHPSVDYLLRQFETDGKVESKIIGNSLAWSLTPEAEA